MPPTPEDSNSSSEDEVSEAEMTPDEHEIGALEENPISFRLSGPNERLSRFDQSDEKPVSSGDAAVHSSRRKLRGRLTRNEKGKKKMSVYDTDKDESDRRESDSEKSDDGPSRAKSMSASKASTLANEQLADLPTKRTLLCGSDTTSTWRITMHT